MTAWLYTQFWNGTLVGLNANGDAVSGDYLDDNASNATHLPDPCITAPPVAPRAKAEPLWRMLARALAGKATPEARLASEGARAPRGRSRLS